MGLRGEWRVFKCSFKANFVETLRYFTLRGAMISDLITPIFILLTAWMINAVMIGAPGSAAQQYFQGITGMSSYLTFSITGAAFYGFVFAAVMGGGNVIRSEQQNGTIELVFLAPGSRFSWLFGRTMAEMHYSVIQAVVLLVFGQLVFGMQLSASIDILLAVFSVLLTILAHMSFAFLYAGLVVFVRNSQAINEALWPLMLFFGGITFPVQILPGPLRVVSDLLPLTYGLQIFRGVTMLGWTFAQAWPSILVLIVMTVALLPLGYIVLRRIERNMRKSGMLATY